MKETSVGVFEAADIFGVTLNGKPAKLSVSPKSRLAEVKTYDEKDRAVFNWSLANRIVKEKGGRFFTLGNREDVISPLHKAKELLGV